MARDAGITGLHARYGDVLGRHEFELLKRVSHWTDENVRREAACGSFEGWLTLRSGFRDIFRYLKFSAFKVRRSALLGNEPAPERRYQNACMKQELDD
jgi:hypothetical protein